MFLTVAVRHVTAAISSGFTGISILREPVDVKMVLIHRTSLRCGDNPLVLSFWFLPDLPEQIANNKNKDKNEIEWIGTALAQFGTSGGR